jgi:hypothetical protein
MRAAGASKAGWQSTYARWLALTDLIAVVAAVGVAQWIRFGSAPTGGAVPLLRNITYLEVSVVIVLGWMAALTVNGARSTRVIGSGVEEYRRVWWATISVFGTVAIATAALRHFWGDAQFEQDIARRGALLERRLDAMAAEHGLSTRGRGMMRGIDVGSGEVAQAITAACFAQGLIIETSGAHDEIVKILAPLVIEDAVLSAGLDILEESIRSALTVTYGVAAE